MKFHEIAEMYFPLMETSEFNGLVADIKVNGLLEPLWLWQGKILDGRNRWNACCELGIKPQFREYTGDDSHNFVVSMNLHRRHLNAYQRSLVALKLKPALQEEAKKRQGRRSDIEQNSVQCSSNMQRTQRELAGLANVSHDTIFRVEFINEKGTDQQKERASTGKSSINAIYKEVKRIEKKEEIKHIPQQQLRGKYNVFLADPPWQYEPRSAALRGVADDHYPTMTLEEIQNIPIKDAILKNAVLFLWTTTAMLKKAFLVMEAWGFEFKTSMVWVKPNIGTGFYVRSKHEIVLIGVKGSFLPMTTDIPDSVFFAEKTGHSRKPEKMYEIIEKMYPGQRYLELFQRGKLRDGWEGWGLESNV